MPHRSLQIIHDEHASLAAVLGSIRKLVDRGPSGDGQSFFDVLRGMLFYIDEFPERLHHTKESDLLFPRVVRAAPHLLELVTRLERDHMRGEQEVRELQHLLLAWELLGEPRRAAFMEHCTRYLDFYQEHMRLEETVILPEAQKYLSEADWKALDTAFEQNRDPLSGRYPPDPAYDRLFTRMLMTATSTLNADL